MTLKKAFFYFFEDMFMAKLEASKEKASRPSTSPAVKPPPESPRPKSPPQSQRTTSPTFSGDSANSSESYKFAHNCGKKIAVMLAGKKARRIE